MTPRFVRHSDAAVRAVPVAPGAPPPKPDRAARAGFGGRAGQVAGQVAEVLTKKRRLLLIRAGDDLEAAGALAAARLSLVEHIAIDAREWSATDAARLAAGTVLRAWRYHRHLTRPDPERPILARLEIMVADPDAARNAWAALAPGIEGALYARELVAEPGNLLTPATFAERLRALEADGLTVEVLGPDRLAAEGFGGLLAVGRGSANPPRLVVLRWPGTIAAPPVLFVGKGVTFDTGGICIKPATPMWEMRADMSGAAACAGAMLALARRRSPAPAVAVLPLVENMVGAASYRPGDVLRLQNGSTVEIVDTDAEGRIILADALAWAIDAFKPQAAIDLATLTGSIVTALGHHMAGLFSTDDVLAAHLAAAGSSVDERAWRMPLSEAYRDALLSDIADIRQCAEGRLQPDACHAALFLRGFVADVPWAHLDIAGVEAHETASDRHPAGPTGWGVRLLDRLVQDRFEDPHRP
jgi:leucyl aminopeptidase